MARGNVKGNVYISPKLLWEYTGYIWRGEKACRDWIGGIGLIAFACADKLAMTSVSAVVGLLMFCWGFKPRFREYED